MQAQTQAGCPAARRGKTDRIDGIGTIAPVVAAAGGARIKARTRVTLDTAERTGG